MNTPLRLPTFLSFGVVLEKQHLAKLVSHSYDHWVGCATFPTLGTSGPRCGPGVAQRVGAAFGAGEAHALRTGGAHAQTISAPKHNRVLHLLEAPNIFQLQIYQHLHLL